MSDDLWIVVPRWRDFQHYKDRDPTWIKNYVRLLDDENYLNLTETQRCTLHGVWMAYAKADGRLAADTRKLSNKLSLRITKRTLDSLIQAGFIELSASRPLALRYQDASEPLAQSARARTRSQEAEEEQAFMRSSSSKRTKDQPPAGSAKKAPPPANGRGDPETFFEPNQKRSRDREQLRTNLGQPRDVGTEADAAYSNALSWLRDGGYLQSDWLDTVRDQHGVTDDADIDALELARNQLVDEEQPA